MTQTVRIPAEILPADGRFNCGPSKIRDAQVAALAAAGGHLLGTSHRKAPVKDLVHRIKAGLADFFPVPDGYEVILGNGGATAFWDAAVFGLIEQRSAHGVFGEFGAKFAAAATAAPWLAAPAVTTAEYGGVALPDDDATADVFAWTHNETSTGAAAPVVRVGGDHGALTVIDATSAAGGLAVDLTQTDVYYFAPQKNFGSDGGLWLAVVSPAAVERIERIAASGRYIPQFLSLSSALKNSRADQTLNTPAVATLIMLAAQIDWLNELGGLSWATERTATSAAVLYDWAARTAYTTPFVTDPAARSNVVATIDFADGVDASVISRTLRSAGVVDIDPYRSLGRNQLRIALFPAIEPSDVERLTLSIDYVAQRIAAG